MTVPVPAWNALGVIDPIDLLSPTTSHRSPYRVSLLEFVDAFGTSSSRVAILKGLLAYRAELRSVGIAVGFQWLDGSFLENVELIERREPGDIDVVTFYEMPPGKTQMSLRLENPALFPQNGAELAALKRRYHADAYLQALSARPAQLVAKTAYWYSMWSHRRDLSWKGFVEVDLDGTDDQVVQTRLDELSANLAAGGVQAAGGPVPAPTGGHS